MTDLSANTLQSNILVQSLLEALFNAELSYTAQGSIPKDLEGKPLEEFQCASTWISYNKLVKDIHQIVGNQVKKVVSPNSKCRICLRDIDTQEVDGRYFTSFIFAIDPLGNVPDTTISELRTLNEKVYALRKVVDPKTLGCFTPEDIVIGIFESTGAHTIPLELGDTARGRNGQELESKHTSFSWRGITELQTKASEYIFGLSNAYQLGATIYILGMVTHYNESPKPNVTTLRYSIAHPEF